MNFYAVVLTVWKKPPDFSNDAAIWKPRGVLLRGRHAKQCISTVVLGSQAECLALQA